jgi:hypothetical protein
MKELCQATQVYECSPFGRKILCFRESAYNQLPEPSISPEVIALLELSHRCLVSSRHQAREIVLLLAGEHPCGINRQCLEVCRRKRAVRAPAGRHLERFASRNRVCSRRTVHPIVGGGTSDEKDFYEQKRSHPVPNAPCLTRLTRADSQRSGLTPVIFARYRVAARPSRARRPPRRARLPLRRSWATAVHW